MNISRSLRLASYHNKQFVQRLRYDLGRELVVLISSAVLLGLFAYIFRDFLGEKLKAIPSEEQIRIGRGFATMLLLALGPIIAGPLHKLWKETSGLRDFAFRTGDDPGTIRAFLWLQTCLWLFISYGLYWRFIGQSFGRYTTLEALVWQCLSLILAGARWLLHRSSSQVVYNALLDDSPSTRARTLMLWRAQQILRRNRLAKLCLALALVLMVGMGVLFALGAPFALGILVSMVIGLLVGSAPAFQLEEDMRSAWFDRQIAVSHEEFVKIYQTICVVLALVFGGLGVLTAFVTRGFGLPLETLKILPVIALYPLMFPALMFQIAAERPFLQIMTMALVGLFLGTAIYAHWAALVVLPIGLVYAKQYQQNNFYRS